MALLTKRAADALLKRIYETGGLTESMEADIERLRDDFDEREGILRRYGEVYDGEDRDEYDFTETVPETDENAIDYKAEYEALKQRYIDRFFGGGEPNPEVEVEEETVIDGDEITYDDLFNEEV